MVARQTEGGGRSGRQILWRSSVAVHLWLLSRASGSIVCASSLWADRRRRRTEADKLSSCPSSRTRPVSQTVFGAFQQAKVQTQNDNISSRRTVLHHRGPKENSVCVLTCEGFTGNRLSLTQIVREITLLVSDVMEASAENGQERTGPGLCHIRTHFHGCHLCPQSSPDLLYFDWRRWRWQWNKFLIIANCDRELKTNCCFSGTISWRALATRKSTYFIPPYLMFNRLNLVCKKKKKKDYT